MKKQVKKWLTLIMAFALILGSVKYSPMSASATEVSVLEFEDTVTSGDVGGFGTDDEETVSEDIETVSGDVVVGLLKAQTYSMVRNTVGNNLVDSIETNSDDDKRLYAVTTAVDGQNNFKEIRARWGTDTYTQDETNMTTELSGTTEVLFNLDSSDYIDASKVESITFAMSSHSGEWTYKVVIDNNNAYDVVKYNVNADTYNIPIAVTSGSITGIVVMGNSGFSGTFDGIMVDMTDKPLVEKTYTFKELGNPSSGYGYSGADDSTPPSVDADTGAVTITYKSAYSEIRYKIPDELADNIRKIILNNSVDGADSLYLKLKNGDSTLAEKDAPELAITSNITGYSELAIMQNAGGSSLEHTLNSVTFLARLETQQTEGGNLLDTDAIGGDKEEDKYLYATVDTDNFSEIKCRWVQADNYSFDTDNKTVSLSGQGEWLFTLATPIDISKVNGIKFAMSDSTGTWAYKTVIDSTDDAKYGLSASIYTFPLSVAEGTLTAIVIYSGDSSFQGTFHGMWVDMKSADEPTETYTITVYASALQKAWANAASSELGEDKRYKITFTNETNKEAYLNLPTIDGGNINLADCESITFNVKDQTTPVNFYVGNSGNKQGSWYYYTGNNAYVLIPTEMNPVYSGEIDAVGVQVSGNDDNPPQAGEVALESVVFTMTKTADQEDQVYGDAPIDEPVDLTENITPETTSDSDRRFTVKDGGLTVQSANGVTYTPMDTEKILLDFSGAWNEIKFALPEEIDLAYGKTVTFAISSQTVPMCFKLYDTEGNEVKADYSKTGNCTMDISGGTAKIASVAIMLHSDDVDSINTCLFDGVLFVMNDPDMETHEVSFSGSEIEVLTSEGNATYTETDGKYTVAFPALNAGVSFRIPKTINMENCVNIQFTVSGQTGLLNYYLEMDGVSKDQKYNFAADQSVHTMVSSLTTGGINGIKIQCAGQEYVSGSGVTLEKITFIMKGSDGTNDFLEEEESEPDTEPGTENITQPGDGIDDLSYQAGDLTKNWGNATDSKTSTNQLKLTFAAQYDQIKLNLPEEIDLLQCDAVTFYVTSQTGSLYFKLYDGDTEVWTKAEQTGQNEYRFEISSVDKVNAIGVMNNTNGSASCVFDGIMFEMSSEDRSTHTLTYTVDQLELGTSNAAACDKVDDAYVMTFAALNEQVSFKLPAIINIENCINIQVVVSGQTGPVNYYLDLNSLEKKAYYYNPANDTGIHIITPDSELKGGINEIRIQCGGESYTPNSGITLEKIIFTMRGSDETNDYLDEEDANPEPEKVPADGPNITPEGTTRITAGEMTLAHANVSEWDKTTEDQIKMTFNGEWSELTLALPETIDMLQCKGVTFAVSNQTVPISFKLYKEDGLSEDPIFAVYHLQNDDGLYTYEISSAEKVKYVGIMLHKDDMEKALSGELTCIFDGIVFDIDSTITTETYTVTYPAHELTLKTSEAGSCELNDSNNWLIQFSDKDQKVNFRLPETVNLEKCVNIIVTVATQNGPVNFYVSADSVQQGSTYNYNIGKTVYTLEPNSTGKINEFGIQCGREDDAFVPGAFIELISVSFLMRGTEPAETPADNNYPIGSLYTSSTDAGVTQEIDEDGAATITFPKAGDSITYEVPDAVEVNHLTSMEFLPFLSGVRVELLNAKGEVLMSGTDSVLETNCNPEVKYIRLVSLADNTVLDLDSIKFNVDPNAFESIVLNGNFAREDLSMWNGIGTWGNATITAKTSDTEIGEGTGIYTYGEITGRESPYHSFAQDVSDRTTHQTGYIFSFWAKLSDDYKGASAELRTVEFSPYYIDANGNTNYNMYRTGSYKQVLEPGVWTHFYGVVNLPSGAQGFVIRIVEQGTNYGQGECLMGSYAVTGVSLTPTALAAEPSYNWSGGGSHSNVITKEATCEVVYELKDLSIDWASANASAKSNGMMVEFTNNYDEVRLKLPRTLDMSTCAYIILNVPAQNVPIALKLYRKGQQVDVAYYNDITGTYLLVPEYDGLIDAIGIMSLATPNPAGAYALADLITFGLTQEPAPEEVSNSIIINGDFADEDMSDWSAALWGDGVTITQQTASKPIYGNTYTYATYSRRTSPYQCFAQDITDRVQQNETYTFSFWAKLSDDYKGAPESQRVVQFAPYTVDKNGKEDYNPRLDGTYAQVLEPGVWTYFEGTYKITNDNPISKVVVRILEQGTNYGQGDCVKGSYSVAGVQMAKYVPDPPSIEEDVPDLKDAMTEVFGDDFIVGTAMTVNELDDLGIEMLVNKHFNAVTIGNELKPDALFNYSNDEHTPLQTITFNGEELEVPTLYFGRAEEILDTLKAWNETHPDEPIKVRGHVLVWHSQTPEWFFREGYTVEQNADGSENYVTPEVMNLRLEWYIKTVLEHFTGEDSPYKDMFYGWDVVNEAVSNGGNGYRTEKASAVEPLSQSTHSTNSSWWAVYQSNEYILNAFKYANQYAPADVELYYNDYNECDSKKVVGIVKLLTDVKEAEGTRIDGMGMQGHYNLFNPSTKDIESAIRAYSEVVDKVMYTEFDLKVSGDISNETSLQKEYIAQAERYHDVYVLLKNLNEEDGINIGGFTVWGTVDKYSWLQSSSDVGGGADDDLTQCPLLFDSNYKVKPSYWAFVDYTMVDPDWTEEKAAEEDVQSETTETSETTEVTESTQTQSETESVAVNDPVVEEQKKNSPAVSIAIAIGAVVLGAGAGTGFYFFKKKKKITK